MRLRMVCMAVVSSASDQGDDLYPTAVLCNLCGGIIPEICRCVYVWCVWLWHLSARLAFGHGFGQGDDLGKII
jgi:hypothetical protein